MSSDNEKVVESWFDAFNRQDWDSYADHLTDDCIYHDQYEGTQTKEELVARMPNQDYLADSKVLRIDKMISSGDSVAVEWTWKTKHVGEYYGIPATGKTITLPVIFILDLNDGKIQKIRNMHNVDHLLRILRTS